MSNFASTLDISTLNAAQLDAVTAKNENLLVIAGAGSGKTRTIVYRIAWLIEQGYDPHSMLLLTFTRKASQEMLNRASSLLDSQLMGITGGTFHGFAFSILRHYTPSWANGAALSILDAGDSASILSQCKESKKIGKGDRSFPKNQMVMGLLSKSRNKEDSLEEIVRKEASHLWGHLEALQELETLYTAYKREHFVLDYDDLLFELETLLRESPHVLAKQHERFSHILVDEYQDTNLVQARLIRLLVGESSHVMAVGDDAQSIYAFRGASVQNILNFPQFFPDTRIIRLEENYRSLQPILNVANSILKDAPSGYRKTLFSNRDYESSQTPVRLYRPRNDRSQARIIGQRIEDLLYTSKASEIAVLFRAGYQSYQLEVELNKKKIKFKKYGGLRYAEASHIKDVLSYIRLLVNPLDLPAFERLASLCKGIGPKTAHKLFVQAMQNDLLALEKGCKKFPDFWEDLGLLKHIREQEQVPNLVLRGILEHYEKRIEILYPDDWPRRVQGLEELVTISANYTDLGIFLADLSLDTVSSDENEEEALAKITLSTVHSAKGLEWDHVIVMDLVEDRFPSRHAMTSSEEYEEERRLLYVACTRARDTLNLFVPQTIFQRSTGFEELATPSPFIRDLESQLYEEFFENYGGFSGSKSSSKDSYLEGIQFQAMDTDSQESTFHKNDSLTSSKYGTDKYDIDKYGASNYDTNNYDKETYDSEPRVSTPKAQGSLCYCTHKIFGRGKIIENLDDNKVRVNFSGMGLKVIMKNYLVLEE